MLNPLLTNVAALKGGTKVAVEVKSQDMRLPSSVVDIHVDPIRVQAGSTPFWDSFFNLLKVKLCLFRRCLIEWM